MSTKTIGTRLHRFIAENEAQYPGATGELSALLAQIGLAGKRISRALSQAGLMDILGASGETNVQGETQQKLDAIANDIFLDAFAYGQLVPAVVTEEMELAAYLPENEVNGKYVVFVDPLDGSSNLDVNGGVGSIFSVRRIDGGGAFTSEDDLIARVSRQQVAAGYFVFGPSTMLVYTCGTASGVQGFTLDPGIGEFLLSHPDIRIPAQGLYYAANEGNVNEWEAGPREFVKWLQSRNTPSGRPYGTRYSGALVSDVHRILLKGGVYFYPATHKAPDGKLRLLYEAAPLAMVLEEAGGAASSGTQRILDVPILRSHQRTPLYIGGTAEISALESFVRAQTA
ncbi:MAG: class 1 fructose-bisphosphatase [Acidobacteria bacterium]|nr:class 1 fructose-bisphosphatase [Acidobacteriota bacterium]